LSDTTILSVAVFFSFSLSARCASSFSCHFTFCCFYKNDWACGKSIWAPLWQRTSSVLVQFHLTKMAGLTLTVTAHWKKTCIKNFKNKDDGQNQ
jgi:hypothetical protein